LAATEHNHLCRGQNDSVITDSPALFAAGMELTRRTFAEAEKLLGWKPQDLDEFVLHQMSAAFNSAFNTTFGVDPSKAFCTFPEFGNVGPASIPLTLCKSAELGRIKRGARVALAGIGSGLNCSMMEVQW
jgi:3-oxoacyl-[acyl-carrier-protein] synthase III